MAWPLPLPAAALLECRPPGREPSAVGGSAWGSTRGDSRTGAGRERTTGAPVREPGADGVTGALAWRLADRGASPEMLGWLLYSLGFPIWDPVV